jgi:hypothetical protein
MATEEELAFDLRRVTTLTVEHVAAFLRRTAEIDDLPTAYADQRARPATGLGFDCFPQQVLAEAFVLARCGLPNAHEVLREYLEASAVAEATALQIEGLLREARLVRER